MEKIFLFQSKESTPWGIIIHYGEIALKGRKNRYIFENKLVFNIKKALYGERFDFVKKISGRLVLKLNPQSNVAAIGEKLKKIFGITYFCYVFLSSQDLEILQKDVLKWIKEYIISRFLTKNYPPQNQKHLPFTYETKTNFPRLTFKIETKRSQKDFPQTSPEISEKIGRYVLKNFPLFFSKDKKWRGGLKVDLKNPQFTCFIEIVEKYAFVYFEKIKGCGGLPTGTSGKIVSLISSGFDSPVASYFLARRGAQIIFVHFESTPQTSSASIENVKELIKKLTEYQLKSKLYLVPFLEIQKEIIKNCQIDLAVVLYRRMMIRIANEIAKKEGARALALGDNLGQVASQTLENIEVINQVAEFPVFRPLIGFDKEEIINFAKKISTYEISSRPYEDCCSLFIPRHPKTKAKLAEVEKEEEKIEINRLVAEALKKAKIEEFYL